MRKKLDFFGKPIDKQEKIGYNEDVTIVCELNYAREGTQMKQAIIRLTSIQDVRDFVNLMTSQTMDVDLTSGRYTVDAKSIMGIFSLDLLQPIVLTAHGDDCDELMQAIEKFVVKE